MPIRFNADEILQIAQEIERSGNLFYSTAAQHVTDISIRELLLNLAKWEQIHEEIFSNMRAELEQSEKEATSYDPQNQLADFLKHVAEGKVFPISKSDFEDFTEKPIEEVIEEALTKEKDSIIFYTAMINFTPAKLGKEKIKKIIDEEIGHIAQLISIKEQHPKINKP